MPIDIAPASLEIQWDTPESNRRHRRSLSIRAETLLARARELIELPPWSAERDGEGLAELAQLLDSGCRAIMDRLRQECHGLRPVQLVDAAELAMELQRLHQEHQQWIMGQRLRTVITAQDVLGSQEGGLSEAFRRAAGEACRTLGFDRMMIFRLSGTLLVAEATHFVGRVEWARDCHAHAQQHPVDLGRDQLEAAMVRRRAAALVTDPMSDPNAWAPIVRKIETPGYVAAPVLVRGEVVGTLHGDTQITGRQIGIAERDALAAYAIGLGYAIERVLLMDRLRAQREAMQRVVDSTDQTIAEFLSSEGAGPGPSALSTAPPRRSSPTNLSRREREVLQLLLTGVSNQEIAAHLVLTVDTVKSHVRSILRKTGAGNRAQLIALSLRETQDRD